MRNDLLTSKTIHSESLGIITYTGYMWKFVLIYRVPPKVLSIEISSFVVKPALLYITLRIELNVSVRQKLIQISQRRNNPRLTTKE
jgi:hypothetical protein